MGPDKTAALTEAVKKRVRSGVDERARVPVESLADLDVGEDRPDPIELLTEQDHKELMSLLNQNISMDFILEMKEAFQLFDKVRSHDVPTLSLLCRSDIGHFSFVASASL